MQPSFTFTWSFNYFFTFSLLLSFYFSQLPTLFPPGKGPFRFARLPSSLNRYPPTSSSSPSTALDGSFPFTCRLLMWACLKTERLRWGSPTATAPFALFWLSNLCEILVLFLLPCLCFCFFREIPWQMLHLILALFPSVAKPSHCAGWVAFS